MLPYMDADITTFSDYSVIGRQMAQSAAFAISAFRFEFFFSNFFFRFVCLLFVLISFFPDVIRLFTFCSITRGNLSLQTNQPNFNSEL